MAASNPARGALVAAGVDHQVVRHGRVTSLAEAAAARGVAPVDLVKTMVVRVASDDHRFVLVPGDRVIAWPRLRSALAVTRMTMADQDVARRLTGYERGTITPFGSRTALPVIADERIRGRTISMGMGEHGAGVTVAADYVVAALDAVLTDVTDPE
jgi:prolyl-tRNA editing enzyme YbaK/EbsC (Cys-tRNA(Pro) deacylase)